MILNDLLVLVLIVIEKICFSYHISADIKFSSYIQGLKHFITFIIVIMLLNYVCRKCFFQTNFISSNFVCK